MIEGPATELPWVWAGLAAYALATFAAIQGLVFQRNNSLAMSKVSEHVTHVMLWGAVILLTVALAERWIRIGHGPFVNLFELLISQMFSLGLVYVFVYVLVFDNNHNKELKQLLVMHPHKNNNNNNNNL